MMKRCKKTSEDITSTQSDQNGELLPIG
jgi:hypothetical protein